MKQIVIWEKEEASVLSNKFGPEKTDALTYVRDTTCSCYNDCITYVVQHGWAGFTCKNCVKFRPEHGGVVLIDQTWEKR